MNLNAYIKLLVTFSTLQWPSGKVFLSKETQKYERNVTLKFKWKRLWQVTRFVFKSAFQGFFKSALTQYAWEIK